MKKKNVTAKPVSVSKVTTVTTVKPEEKVEATKASTAKVESAVKVELNKEADKKAEERVAEVKVADTKATEKKSDAKEGKKVAEKKTTAKQATAKKAELKPEVFVQFNGNEALVENVIEKAKQQYVAEGHRVSTIKSLQVYVKPEEYAAYYVINEKTHGRVDLF